jgi:hypothetical protein
MTSREYTQEVGLKSGTPRVPWPLAVVLLGLSAAGLCYGALTLHRMPSTRRGASEPVSSHAAMTPKHEVVRQK